jgi:hypothetical protein
MSRTGVADYNLTVFTLDLDAPDLRRPVSLVKIDVEGHGLEVIQGMRRLIARHQPVLIVEGNRAVRSFLESLGYRGERRPGSPNFLWRFGQNDDLTANAV